MADPVVEIRGLRFRWPGTPSVLLELDALRVDAGERLLVLGPSGSGKSTLLGLVGAVLTAGPGEVRVLGHDPASLSAGSRDRLRVDHIGFLFQQFNLLPWLSPVENVLLPCRFSARRARRASGDDRPSRPLRAEAIRLLERLGIDAALASRAVGRLSVGQQQRVAAARALIGRPELLLADEPTSALDPQGRDQLMDLLADEAGAQSSGWICVSHDEALVPRFDRTLRLGDMPVPAR